MNDNKMWALVKEKAAPGLALKRVDIPEVGTNDVKIKIHKTAICGTDVHIYQWNEWAQHTIAVGQTAGHEYVGEIVEVGPGVQGFKVGDIVSGEGHITCGKCRNCLEGHKENCKDAKGVGVNRDGWSRIILTRPAIEAGEKLGFLPGDLQSKVDPYLRPLYDALYQIMGADSFAKNMEKGLIEVAPLAYMRGRTLDNAFIILDEAQNTTPAQMKMFLTRIGFGSKVIITGDTSQKDLPRDAVSGLDVAMKVLKKIEDIGFCQLTSKDVVRHPLVQQIVQAYDAYEKKQKTPRKPGRRG